MYLAIHGSSSLQGYHVDTLTMDRVSPLHEACLGGHYACVKFLLDNGANVRSMSNVHLNACLFLRWPDLRFLINVSSLGGRRINPWCHTALQLLQKWECCLCQAHLAAQYLHQRHTPSGIAPSRGCKEW